MTGSDRRREIRTQLRRVERVLYEIWDPLGIAGAGPKDEYSAYAPRVLQRIHDGASSDELAAFLDALALDELGVSPIRRDSVRAAESLLGSG